jgi:iron(III) transport system ATP-binding protein
MADLTVSDVALRYGGNEVLRAVSLTVPAGKVVALLGAAGSGKTALLRAIAGLDTPHRGTISIGEQVWFDADRRIDVPVEGRGLGLLAQSPSLWPHHTVFDNVAYGLMLRRVPAEEISARVRPMLEMIGLGETAGQHPLQLSAAEQQRVALARTLICDPELVLLDEPLSQFDAKSREEARSWLRQLIVSTQRPVLLTARDRLDAMALSDHIILLNGGAIEQEGTPSELYQQPASRFAAEFMGHHNRLEGTLLENAEERAAIEVIGIRLEGHSRTRAAVGEKATGIIRLERVLLGGGPGVNRIPMSVRAQLCLGERWEVVFAKDTLTARTYVAAPLKHEFYHLEFPPQALWIF